MEEMDQKCYTRLETPSLTAGRTRRGRVHCGLKSSRDLAILFSETCRRGRSIY